MLLFSRENLNYFQEFQPEVAKKAFLIQGRVKTVEKTSVSDRALFDVPCCRRRIFCVARFSPEKMVIFERGILFFEKYFSEIDDAFLYIIGLPSHPEVTAAIEHLVQQSALSDRMKVLKTPQYYQNVSRFFELADYLVGNGRTVIEAMSLGVPSLVATEGRDEPVLITELSLSDLAVANLSSRSIVSDQVYDRVLGETDASIRDRESFLEIQVQSKNLFEKYYSIRESQKKIHEAIIAAQADKEVIKSEWNDLRMLSVGVLFISFPKILNFFKDYLCNFRLKL